MHARVDAGGQALGVCVHRGMGRSKAMRTRLGAARRRLLIAPKRASGPRHCHPRITWHAYVSLAGASSGARARRDRSTMCCVSPAGAGCTMGANT
jgi:hypothetical protein